MKHVNLADRLVSTQGPMNFIYLHSIIRQVVLIGHRSEDYTVPQVLHLTIIYSQSLFGISDNPSYAIHTQPSRSLSYAQSRFLSRKRCQAFSLQCFLFSLYLDAVDFSISHFSLAECLESVCFHGRQRLGMRLKLLMSGHRSRQIRQ